MQIKWQWPSVGRFNHDLHYPKTKKKCEHKVERFVRDLIVSCDSNPFVSRVCCVFAHLYKVLFGDDVECSWTVSFQYYPKLFPLCQMPNPNDPAHHMPAGMQTYEHFVMLYVIVPKWLSVLKQYNCLIKTIQSYQTSFRLTPNVDGLCMAYILFLNPHSFVISRPRPPSAKQKTSLEPIDTLFLIYYYLHLFYSLGYGATIGMSYWTIVTSDTMVASELLFCQSIVQ